MSLITTSRLRRLWQDAQIHPERVDLVVEKMDSSATTVGTLLFLKAKRASASPSDFEELEYQAFTAACAYYVETGIRRIWMMTCVGSSARLWIFSESSTYLIPFIPAGQGLAERSEYLEISTHGREIADGLEYIKKHMTPPRQLLNMTPSPRPANATLPAGWHDSEVVQLDTLRQQVPPPMSFDPMDFEAGPSSSAIAQFQQEISFGLGGETSSWATGEELQQDSAGDFEAQGNREASSSEGHRGGDDRKEVEERSYTVIYRG
ncbi:Type I restriction enzyme R protein N-terminal domain-containing protein [Madurella fahalii]|uniref:Type I restriction enzyme R protein N-terminal domain-containing protein n=1 Tax=Madurella fahalii TaxID=1157608 RepID=A0ABQ0FWP7_9PEZI